MAINYQTLLEQAPKKTIRKPATIDELEGFKQLVGDEAFASLQQATQSVDSEAIRVYVPKT